MNLVNYQSYDFPVAHRALADQLVDAELEGLDDSLVVFGGSARSSLLEAVESIERPIRDIDLTAIGESCDDERYRTIHMQLNPQDDPTKIFIPRFPDTERLFADNIDFTINQAAIELGNGMQLTASSLAVEACHKRLVQVTEGRVIQTEGFGDKADPTAPQSSDAFKNWKKYIRNCSNVPARAAYFVAVFRAAGVDFDYDLLDHPRQDKTHTFYLGLMTVKALQIDETERGPGDTTATDILFDVYGEMGLTTGAKPNNVKEIVSYLESINQEHPQFKPNGSKIAELVKPTDRKPAPRIV